MKNNRDIYASKNLSFNLKVRHFNCFETSIFLYNSALWTLTPTLSKSIDSFQRCLLRKALGIKYPKIIKNEDLYQLTNATPWSEIIGERRLRLFGHICRLHPDTPARQSLTEATRPQTRKVGRPKLTWVKLIKNDLEKIGIQANEDFSNIISIANDRESWKDIVGNLHKGRKLLGRGASTMEKPTTKV